MSVCCLNFNIFYHRGLFLYCPHNLGQCKIPSLFLYFNIKFIKLPFCRVVVDVGVVFDVVELVADDVVDK